jgi:hypothetical protein
LSISEDSVDVATCDSTDASQSFIFSDDADTGSGPAVSVTISPSATNAVATQTTVIASTSAAAATTTAPSIPANSASSSPSIISVSRAGVVLNPSAVAEANPRDDTATRAFSNVAIKSSDGQCLNIDSTAGDFRENLIPITLATCDGSAGQQWDFITAGKHNDVANSTLIVSSLTQGCMNFDPRRAAGDTTIIFSCGGRADGGGSVTNSQLFPFQGGETRLTLEPENGNGQICLAPNGGKLDSANCDGGAGQVFTIV